MEGGRKEEEEEEEEGEERRGERGVSGKRSNEKTSDFWASHRQPLLKD